MALIKGGFKLVRKKADNKNTHLKNVRLEIKNSKNQTKYIGLLCDFENKIVYLAEEYKDEYAEIIERMIE